MNKNIVRFGLVAVCMMTALLSSCIDEDMSDCGHNYTINYTVRLRTNMHTEIETELTTEAEKAFGAQLQSALSNVFSDHANDMDLSFFTDGNLAHHESHDVGASETSFTIYLPVADYRHLALANTGAEPLVNVSGTQQLSTLAIEQQQTDTIASHGVGLFSARLPMLVEDGIDQTFQVDLYMQNCAAALVVDLNGQTPTAMETYINGTAAKFSVSDSTYDFSRAVVVGTKTLRSGNFAGFYAASLPSPDATRADDSGLWTIDFIVTMADGKTTKNTLVVEEPLYAGNLKIIKARLNADGSVEAISQAVGVHVTLDWKKGGEHEIIM